MIDPVTASAISISVKALERPLGDLYGAATGTLKALAKKWNASGKRDALVQTISEAERVRTIFSSTPVPLSTFYYPSRISEFRSQKPARQVDELNAIHEKNNLLILGTVGQGKSILMRYLCIQELRSGRTVPIFLELRTLESTDSIQSKLIEELGILGFDGLDQSLFYDLLDHGNFIFFLDGFDELKRELALAVQSELMRLMKRAPQTRWVISSRPGSLSTHISGLPNLHAVQIEPLADDDFDPFLKALRVPDDTRARLVEAITSSPGEIKGVLKTPLMLTLLNLTFGTSTHIPETLHEFYESMFLFLVYRHDETKPGYVRQKATQLSNAELQEAFEYFCFLSKDHGVSLSDEDFNVCAKNSSKLSELNFTPEGFRADLTETVCLMQRDGIRTAFIHRSIQEFFTAFFIKHLGKEDTVKEIYQKIKGPALLSWQQELRFLEQIDKCRYAEYNRLPQIESFLSECHYKPGSAIGVTKVDFVKYLNRQPIYALINTNTSRTGKRNYWIIVATGGPDYSSFCHELGRILQLDGVINQDLSDSTPTKKLPIENEFKKVSKMLTVTELDTALHKFREMTKRVDKERTRLKKQLAERKQNFRDILLSVPSKK